MFTLKALFDYLDLLCLKDSYALLNFDMVLINMFCPVSIRSVSLMILVLVYR